MIKSAQYYEKLDDQIVRCTLCPAYCKLTDGKVGICGSRLNKGGELVTDNYGELVTIAVDPIEKKPLYHFYPGKDILSTGANGCNFACINCQNWTISQRKVRTMYFPPERLVESAKQHGSIGVAFTYTEPMIWFEYLMDTMPLLRKAGLKTVLVTNGYINPEPLRELVKYVDAMNIDLKGIRPEFYLKVCKGKLEPVLDTIRFVKQSGVHLELTNLIIPDRNDSDDDLSALVDFVASVSTDIPLHLSAFHPDYELDTHPTPMATLLRAREIAQSKLQYVYIGNARIEGGSDTFCPQCGRLLIGRDGYSVEIKGLNGSICDGCNYDTGIVQ